MSEILGMDEGMIDHVARAMYERPDKAYPASSHPWETVHQNTKTRYWRQARAAIAAKRGFCVEGWPITEISARSEAGYLVYIEGFGEVLNAYAMKADISILLAVLGDPEHKERGDAVDD